VLLGDLGDRRILRELGWSSCERRAELEERYEGDLSLLAQLHNRVILPVDDAVGVLDLAELHQFERLLGALEIDVGDPDQVDLARLAVSTPSCSAGGTAGPSPSGISRRLTSSSRSTRREGRLAST
jgi:hypothetical protein